MPCQSRPASIFAHPSSTLGFYPLPTIYPIAPAWDRGSFLALASASSRSGPHSNVVAIQGAFFFPRPPTRLFFCSFFFHRHVAYFSSLSSHAFQISSSLLPSTCPTFSIVLVRAFHTCLCELLLPPRFSVAFPCGVPRFPGKRRSRSRDVPHLACVASRPTLLSFVSHDSLTYGSTFRALRGDFPGRFLLWPRRGGYLSLDCRIPVSRSVVCFRTLFGREETPRVFLFALGFTDQDAEAFRPTSRCLARCLSSDFRRIPSLSCSCSLPACPFFGCPIGSSFSDHLVHHLLRSRLSV